MPPRGEAVTTGAVLSIVYFWLDTVPELPAGSLAKYRSVVVVDIEIGELYLRLASVGAVPSVVKNIVVPDSEALRLTLLETENNPPSGEAVTVGDTRSMMYACDEIAPRFPATSLAKNLRVEEPLTTIVEL